MMDRLNISDQRRSDRISYFDHLAYFRMTAPPFNVAVHRAVAPSDGHMPTSLEEQVAGRDAIAEWARITYGWLGRSPDYKAAFLGTLGARVLCALPEQRAAVVSSEPGACAVRQSRHHSSAG
jgi:hypothetical protein